MSLPDLQEPLRLLEEQNIEAAIEALRRKVHALPAHLGAYVLLAHAYEAQERWTEALDAWEDVHFLMPNSPIADAGKRRVLRRMEGIEDDPSLDPAPRPSSPPSAPSPQTGPAPSTDEDEDDDEEAEPDEADTEPPADESAPSSEEESELAQLRRQAEREARQGGARPGLTDTVSSDESPSPEDLSSTPEEQVEQLEDEADGDDLDRLIDKLQSARIDPDPDAEGGAEQAPPPEPDDEDDGDSQEVVSETLARIHEGQGDYERAAHIYDQLAEQEPERADEFGEKAAEMRAKADSPDAEN